MNVCVVLCMCVNVCVCMCVYVCVCVYVCMISYRHSLLLGHWLVCVYVCVPVSTPSPCWSRASCCVNQVCLRACVRVFVRAFVRARPCVSERAGVRRCMFVRVVCA